jgi:hypothetical protein
VRHPKNTGTALEGYDEIGRFALISNSIFTRISGLCKKIIRKLVFCLSMRKDLHSYIQRRKGIW